jgi:hypothetical protein
LTGGRLLNRAFFFYASIDKIGILQQLFDTILQINDCEQFILMGRFFIEPLFLLYIVPTGGYICPGKALAVKPEPFL